MCPDWLGHCSRFCYNHLHTGTEPKGSGGRRRLDGGVGVGGDAGGGGMGGGGFGETLREREWLIHLLTG